MANHVRNSIRHCLYLGDGAGWNWIGDRGKNKALFRADRGIWVVGADHDRSHGDSSCAKLTRNLHKKKAPVRRLFGL